MKKIIIFLIIILLIITGISYMYLNYKATTNDSKIKNIQYAGYLNKEIYGTDLATVINKAVNDNIKNEVQKNSNGLYEDNQKNSIKIDIKFKEDDKIHNMEEVYNTGVDKFMQLYNQIKFKCTKLEYHEKTQLVSYMYFEEVDT